MMMANKPKPDLIVYLESDVDALKSRIIGRDRWEETRLATERLLIAHATGVVPSPVVMDTLLFRFLTPTTFDADDTPLEDPFNEGAPNFLPKADSSPLGAGMVPDDSFFDDADYWVAFGGEDWTEGWTAYPAD